MVDGRKVPMSMYYVEGRKKSCARMTLPSASETGSNLVDLGAWRFECHALGRRSAFDVSHRITKRVVLFEFEVAAVRHSVRRDSIFRR